MGAECGGGVFLLFGTNGLGLRRCGMGVKVIFLILELILGIGGMAHLVMDNRPMAVMYFFCSIQCLYILILLN
jgi:hypothetical protein